MTELDQYRLTDTEIRAKADFTPDGVYGQGLRAIADAATEKALRGVMAQCKTAGVACFVKQVGSVPYQRESDGIGAFGKRAWSQLPAVRSYLMRDSHGGDPAEWPKDLRVREMPEARP